METQIWGRLLNTSATLVVPEGTVVSIILTPHILCVDEKTFTRFSCQLYLKSETGWSRSWSGPETGLKIPPLNLSNR